MTIRISQPQDLDALMDIYSYARRFMQAHGNPTQWVNGYPSAELILQEITNRHSYVCEDEKGEIVGTFCFIPGEDPTYARIDDGEWLNDAPYYVIHRMATSGKQKGVAAACLKWCFEQCGNIRVDTHQDNIVMQNILNKYGFRRCGIIYTHNGTPRIAFQKTLAENELSLQADKTE
ncbi:MAG: GNAT family N-acetyltransferase [Bacteroides sp.]|nr:GNAT family N-acetyltransferase [Bacteroides sp.]